MNNTKKQTLKWYNFIAAFIAGFTLFNAIPHYVNGVSGNPFPTPFADPPGFGLSSPVINVLWAATNILIGVLLWRAAKMHTKNKLSITLFVIGALAQSIMLSIAFTGIEK